MNEIAVLLFSTGACLIGFVVGCRQRAIGFKTKEETIKDLQENNSAYKEENAKLKAAISSYLQNNFKIHENLKPLYTDSFFCEGLKHLSNALPNSWTCFLSQKEFAAIMDEQIFKNKVHDEMRKNLCEGDDDVTEVQVDRMVEKLK